ncbi:MAG: UDP-2,3-diacylglucosamine diphosphatase [Muribaculaceae bacterium]|nr:UDP-2,3-diacylglucosamine diphosphatase [Muribaculaceae bacterium]
MGTKTYFISDLHLGAKYITDARAHEARVVRFLDAIKEDAAALYLLGDILDYWYEYRTVVPRGHVRFFGKLAELADAGVRIYWMTGNHDVWLFDYLRDEVGLTVFKKPVTVAIGGRTLFLSHGDNVGYQRPMYRLMRYCFYNRVCQWLYAGIHPRWTHWMATGWSRHNRTHRNEEDVSREIEASASQLQHFAQEYVQQHPEVDFFVFGHLHLARVSPLDGGRAIVFLGDWITQDTYAVLDGESISLKTFSFN